MIFPTIRSLRTLPPAPLPKREGSLGFPLPSGKVRIGYRLACLILLSGSLCGCTSFQEYFRNGWKVGPNYCAPDAAVADRWIDADDPQVRSETSEQLSQWWTVFNDAALYDLVDCAYRQNLTLRQAGCRVLQARDQWAIAVGQLFPQSQKMTGDYSRSAMSREIANGQFITTPYSSQWNFGFNLAWELDIWGRFRRAVESGAARWQASIEDYDAVLVTLLGDVADAYVRARTYQERIKLTKANVQLQRETLTISEARFQGGTTSELDVYQARSTLEQTEAQVPELEILLRLSTNQLCILLGIPPEDIMAKLAPAPIPTAPEEAAAGIPADLLRRRPDVRRAERLAAAQCAQIGVAEADFYPAFSINGTLGYSAQEFTDLFQSSALKGTVGPSFQWNLLNYGRILNNVRLQEAKFQELVAGYQQTVLNANREVEDGLVTFLRARQRAKHQAASVDDAQQAVTIVLAQYKAGTADFTRVTQVEQTLVRQQDVLAQAQGQIASGLIQVYRALGGGWQIRLEGAQPLASPEQPAEQPVEPAEQPMEQPPEPPPSQ